MSALTDASWRFPLFQPAQVDKVEEFATLADTEDASEYDAWVALPRVHRVPIRASLTVLMVGVVVLEGVLSRYGMAAPTELLLALIPLVGGALYGDTVRPSGMAPASKVKPIDSAKS